MKIKLNKVVRGANALSLGISIVVAIAVGVLLGYWLRQISGINALFWVGVAFGIAAAFKNIHIAYKEQMANMKELEDDPKYKIPQNDETK